jgi:hypothetical protein
VANDAGPNFLYHNKHDGTFEDIGVLAGVALSGDGMEQGSMGVDWGDYVHEGRLSMIVTNFVEQGSTLYHNLSKQNFADVSVRAKLIKPTYPYVSWGTAFFDMDNDGWLDLFIANGHVYPQVDTIPGGTPYREPMLLFRNHHDGVRGREGSHVKQCSAELGNIVQGVFTPVLAKPLEVVLAHRLHLGWR